MSSPQGKMPEELRGSQPSPLKGMKEVPKGNKDLDTQAFLKLADRVEDTILQYALYGAEPRRIPPRKVLVSPNNRDGSAPNLMAIHKGILGSIKQKGFDKRRPQCGFVIKLTSAEAKKKAGEHNRRFTKGCALLPHIHEEEVEYVSLASTHLNLASRCVKEGIKGPQGDLNKLVEESESFRDFVENGHSFIVLKEETPVDRQRDISTWRNQDQNENQPTHEVELLQTIKTLSEDLSNASDSGVGRKVPDSELVARAARRNPTRQPAQALMSYCKYYKSFVEDEHPELVSELVDFHSVKVDPKDLIMPPSFFDHLANSTVLSKTPYLRHYLMLTNYTSDKKEERAGQGVAKFIQIKVLENWVKKPDEVSQLEKLFEDLRSTHLPKLEKAIGSRQARLELQVYVDLIIRCQFAKPWPEDLAVSCPISTGKFGAEKVKGLGIFWGTLLDRNHPQEGFAEALGLVGSTDPGEEGKEEDAGLDLSEVRRLRRLRKTASTPSEEAPPAPQLDLTTDLKPNEEVTVINRSRGVGCRWLRW